MILFSPRVWGYKDYPERVKRKVPAQTRREKVLGALIGVPWIVFVLGFPIHSTLTLQAKLGGDVSFRLAFLTVAAQFAAATFGDLVLIDWLIISRITPKCVIIPGSVREDYRDFSHHFVGHAKAAIVMTVLALLIAGVVSLS